MNKRVIIGIIIAIIVIIVVALGYMFLNRNKPTTENNESIENLQSNKDESEIEIENEKENQNTTSLDKKIIIAYFSLPETNGSAKEDSTITVNGENLGNTQYVANLIGEHTGADVFRIEAVKEYNTSDHQALIDDAKKEQNDNSRPEIKNKINNFDEYDTIFIGYPIWWSDLPQILYTFLESYDFTGKNVFLFSTNGGSGLAGTVSTIKNKLSSANVNENAFTLNRNNMEDAPKKVETWLKEINMIGSEY
ncbi:MAG: flavodoxin [Clostridia bacterium]